MSGKNRAFALAVTTAALVGLSAPVASAASFAGPSGFNNDSVLNVSGNQLPVQTCTGGVQTATAAGAQTVTGILAAIAPTLTTGTTSPTQTSTCTQSPTETNSVTANTVPTTAPTTAPMSGWHHDDAPSTTTGTSGFNNDSVLNLSGNQLPVQTCTGAAQTAAATALQTVAGLVVLFPTLTTGAFTPMQSNSCAQTPTETNTSTVNS